MLFHYRTRFDLAAMASSNWSVEDEKMFQQLAQRRTSQMPLPTTESSGAMTDASKRRIEDAEFEVDPESDWVVGSSFMEPVGGTEDLATKALLPAGVTNMTMWGKTKFACGKYEKEKMSYKTVFEKDPSYVSWCRKHLTKDSAKGPAWDWSRYIKARDLVDCKAANVPFYAGTTLRREFCD